MPVVCFGLVSLLFLSLSRIALMLWQYAAVPKGSITFILLQGLRVDFASVCAVYAPVFLILALLNFFKIKPAAFLLLFRIYLTCAFTFLVLNEAATPAFIQEYGVRPNHLYVQYLIYPQEVLSMLWSGHKIAIFAITAVLIIAFCIGFKIASYFFKDFTIPSFKINLISFILILLILPLGIRSTLGHRPLNPALVSFCDDPLANSLPLNSSYSAMYALAHLNSDKLSLADIYAFDTKENVIKEGLNLSTRVNVKPFNLQAPFNQVITSPYTQRYNVVIILEESLGADFVSSLGGLPLTPCLENLKQEGLWFNKMHAAGHRSIRGIEAVTAGFPPSPLNSIVKLPQPKDSYATLSRIYELAGYKTSFIYGGESHFDNMKTYFLENGTQRVIDQKDYKKPDFVASWGVSDEDLFIRANQEFERMHQEHEPFFSVVFSSSFHDPFDIPTNKVSLGPIKSEEPERLLAAKYADYALGQFFKLAKKSSYYKDTIFLVIADHESRVRSQGNFPLDKFSIPALIIGPNIKAQVNSNLVSQIDIAPTLLYLSGISGEFPFVGQNLMQNEVKNRALMQFNNIFGYLEGDNFITLAPEKSPSFFKVTGDYELQTAPTDDALLKRAVALSNLGPLIYDNGYMSDKNIKIYKR